MKWLTAIPWKAIPWEKIITFGIGAWKKRRAERPAAPPAPSNDPPSSPA